MNPSNRDHPSLDDHATLPKAGYTVSEAVVAVAIMGGILSLFLLSFVSAARWIRNAQNETHALNYAREQMELRRALPFRHPDLMPGIYAVTTECYEATVRIADVGTDAKSLSVDVNWSNHALRAISTARYSTVMVSATH